MYPRLRYPRNVRLQTLLTSGSARSFWLLTHQHHRGCSNHIHRDRANNLSPNNDTSACDDTPRGTGMKHCGEHGDYICSYDVKAWQNHPLQESSSRKITSLEGKNGVLLFGIYKILNLDHGGKSYLSITSIFDQLIDFPSKKSVF